MSRESVALGKNESGKMSRESVGNQSGKMSRPREGCRTAGYGNKIEFSPHTYVRVSMFNKFDSFIDVNETKTGFPLDLSETDVQISP